MIVSWMLYSLLVALLLALGAVPLERALRLGGRPGRWVWVGAMAGAVVLPVVSVVLAGRVAEPTAALGPVTPVAAPVSTAIAGAARGFGSTVIPVLEGLQAPLLRLWALASVGLLALFGASAVRLARFRRAWSEQVVDGDRVLVSQDVGPAVLGLLRPRIVVPRWVVERGPEARSLILRHEREHCRARDPFLVLLGGLLAALLPWNAPLWWCLRRIRLAVELDCDERVLRAAGPGTRRRYAQLLVEVGRRPAGSVRALAAFSERRSALERRIRALSDRLPEDRLRRAAGLGALGVLAAVAACVVPSPDAPASSLEPDLSPGAGIPEAQPGFGEVVPADPDFTPYTDAPVVRNRAEVQRALAREYPPMLRDAGIGGSVDVWLYVDETGRVQDTRVDRSSGHDALDAAAIRVGGVMRFTPALNGDDVVPVWISLPIRFEVRGGDPAEEVGRTTSEPSPAGERFEEHAVSELPPPPEPGGALSVADGPVFTPYTVPPQVSNRTEVQRALVREYPPLLRDAGIGGTVDVWFFIDETGRLLDTRVARSSGRDVLDQAALRVAEAIDFTPARNRDDVVPVWISLPIKFEVR